MVIHPRWSKGLRGTRQGADVREDGPPAGRCRLPSPTRYLPFLLANMWQSIVSVDCNQRGTLDIQLNVQAVFNWPRPTLSSSAKPKDGIMERGWSHYDNPIASHCRYLTVANLRLFSSVPGVHNQWILKQSLSSNQYHTESVMCE